MAQYEYTCTNKECCQHGKIIEVTQKMTEDPFTRCAGCHKGTLQKLISKSSFKKGAGAWESNNYESGAG